MALLGGWGAVGSYSVKKRSSEKRVGHFVLPAATREHSVAAVVGVQGVSQREEGKGAM